MAKLASVFFVFMIQVLVLVTVTEADPQLDVHPTEIVLGTTSSLDINCSFSSVDHPEMAAFTSLILSRTNMSGQAVEDLAAITQFSPDSVTFVTTEKVTATGVHSQSGLSFIQITWDYPSASQTGVYQCVAHGMDLLGELVEIVNSTTVTVAQADLNDIFEKLKEMEIHETAMENKILNLETNMADTAKYVQALEYNNSQMSSHITDLEDTVATLQRFQPMNLIGTYNNHDYYISKEVYTNIDDALDVCKSYGGRLVEIHDRDEFLAIQGFLNTLADSPYIMIAGSDEAKEGHWVFQSDNRPMPYLSWSRAEPNYGTQQNCLHFYYLDGECGMGDYWCKLDAPNYNVRYMCEINSV